MKLNITKETIIKRNPGIVTSNIDGEIVMMSLDNGEYYGLDEIASRIWELIESPISIKELIIILTDEYEVNENECFNDTLGFINELAEKKLVLLD